MSVACNLISMGDRLDSDPTVDFLDKDAVGFSCVSSLSWCLYEYYHEHFDITRLSLCHNLANCLAVICLPIICIFDISIILLYVLYLMQMSVAYNLISMGDRLDSDPTVKFLDKDAVGLNGLCSLS